jgi:DNA-directed RNA polymerase specialized sigma24 family protein
MGFDTQQIADELGVEESRVYNTLSRSKNISYEYRPRDQESENERP